MSRLTPCNFCNLWDIRKYAKIDGCTVTLVPLEQGDEHPLGGIDVLVHKPDEEPDREKHWHAWFMALTDYCCC